MDAERIKEFYKSELNEDPSVRYWRDRAQKAEDRVRDLEQRLSNARPRRARRRALFELLTGEK